MTSGEVRFSTPVPLWAWLVAGVAWPAAGPPPSSFSYPFEEARLAALAASDLADDLALARRRQEEATQARDDWRRRQEAWRQAQQAG